MRETPPAVRSQNSTLRDILPFYSAGHFAFAAVLVAGIYLMMLWLDPPTASVVTLGSFLGIAIVGSVSKPAWMLVAPDRLRELEAMLEKHGWRRERTDDWVPSLPRWLRWSYNRVRIRDQDGAALVTGPAVVLRSFANELTRPC